MSASSLEILISAIDKASAPISGIAEQVDKLQSTAAKASSGFQNFGKSAAKVGGVMTAGITAPVVAAGVAALKASNDFNVLMANVGALSVPTQRVGELKSRVQDLAIATGTSTTQLAEGLYGVVSAFGDSADSMKILEINAKLAKGGLSTVEQALEATSAVAKAYGNSSAAAVSHVSDLALKTVELGQTTLPELAGAIPRVTALSQNLGVSQEELFAVMATGTGVLGNAGEVATQMKAALSGLMAPSERLSDLYTQLGVSGGEALVKQKGFAGALQTITKAAQDAGVPLQDFLGSVEAQQLALGLSGPLAEEYARKYGLIGQAAGSTEKAVTAQTEGVSKMGAEMAKLRASAEVFSQTVGDSLAPTVGAVASGLAPMVQKLKEFAETHPRIVQIGSAFLVVAAAIGPILVAIGAVISAVGTAISFISGIAGAISGVVSFLGILGSTIMAVMTGIAAAVSWPAIAIAALVAGLVAAAIAIVTHWSSVRAFFAGLGAHMVGVFQSIVSGAMSMAAGAADAFMRIHSSAISAAAGIISGFMSAVGGVASAMASIVSSVIGALSGLAGQAFSMGARVVGAIADGISAGIGRIRAAAASVAAAVKAVMPGSPVDTGPLTVLNGSKNSGYKIAEMLAGGISRGVPLVSSAAGSLSGSAANYLPTASSGSSSFNPSVTINVNGGSGDVAGQIDRQLKQTFAQLYRQYQADRARVSYS